MLEKGWINEIHKSRLVILSGEDSYLQGIDMPVWELIKQMADEVTVAKLMQDHPSITQADMRACRLFIYLRITGKL
jgi:uncharacterized protein (DUF433 family)